MTTRRKFGMGIAAIIAAQRAPAAIVRSIVAGRQIGVRLPYVDVEYIESTGTQWIDTGIFLTGNHSVEIDFQLTNAVQTRRGLFGGYATSRYGGLISPSNSKLEFGYGSSNVYHQIDADTSRHLVRQVKNKLYVDGVLVHTFSEASFTSSYSSPLGNFRFTNYNPAFARYYLCRIYDGGLIVRDYQPRLFTNELGATEGAMYDRVSGQLFRNAGTGSFIIGPVKARGASGQNGGGYKWIIIASDSGQSWRPYLQRLRQLPSSWKEAA